jgi:hypothetical protein
MCGDSRTAMHLSKYNSRVVDLGPVGFLNNTMSMVSGVSVQVSAKRCQIAENREQMGHFSLQFFHLSSVVRPLFSEN